MSTGALAPSSSPLSGRDAGFRVSVVVAAYNESQHIGRMVTSLAKQTRLPLEVIVVDDGSTDGTADLARGAGARVIRIDHSGPGHARNVGARRATGDILVFFDGDMSAAPNFIHCLVAPILQGSAVGTFSKEIFIGNADNRWARAYARIRRLALPRLLPESFPNSWANFRAIRRDAFLSAGGYDDVGYGEDMTLAAKLGVLAVSAPGAVCFHFNPSSLYEIYENARWIGRGHDIRDVSHPWRDNSPWRALREGIAESHRSGDFVPLFARMGYHAGVVVGLAQRRLGLCHHCK